MHSKKVKNVEILFLTTIGVFFILTLTWINITSPRAKTIRVLGVETSPDTERLYWENIVEKNPTYRDGFIELAKIETERGNTVASEKLLEKAKLIDPNSINLLRTEVELLSSN